MGSEKIIEPTVINSMAKDYAKLSQLKSRGEIKDNTIRFTPRESLSRDYLKKILCRYYGYNDKEQEKIKDNFNWFISSYNEKIS